jgi:acetyl xylan esterase AXE1
VGAGARLSPRDHLDTYQREVDPERIGVWGSSYSGGHALVVGAIDRRVKCVVSQVPLISGYRNIQRLVRPDFLGSLRAQLVADREARFRCEAPAMIPVVAADPLALLNQVDLRACPRRMWLAADWLPERGGFEPSVSRETFAKENLGEYWRNFGSKSASILGGVGSRSVRYGFPRQP